MIKKILLALTIPMGLLGASACGDHALAQEVTLSAVSGFAQGTMFSENFEALYREGQRDRQGEVEINYRGGGGKVMNPFQLGDVCTAASSHRQSAGGLLTPSWFLKRMPSSLTNYHCGRKNGALDI